MAARRVGAAGGAPLRYPNPAVGYNYADPILPGSAGGSMVPIPGQGPPNSCMMMKPAPTQEYCMPAMFTQVNGTPQLPLMAAYGFSVPVEHHAPGN